MVIFILNIKKRENKINQLPYSFLHILHIPEKNRKS